MRLKSLFVKFFGNDPFIKVIDFLIENRGLDFSKTEIAEGANVGWSTLFKIWPRLEDANLVRITRIYGKTKLYTLDTDNLIIKQFIEIEKQLIENSIKEMDDKLVVSAKS